MSAADLALVPLNALSTQLNRKVLLRDIVARLTMADQPIDPQALQAAYQELLTNFDALRKDYDVLKAGARPDAGRESEIKQAPLSPFLNQYVGQLRSSNRIDEAWRKLLESVATSPPFTQIVSEDIHKRELAHVMARALPSFLPADALKGFIKMMESQIRDEVHEIFLPRAPVNVYITENLTLGRTVALRIALQVMRVGELGAPPPNAVARSDDPPASKNARLSGKPVFYTSAGFSLSAHAENFAFMNGVIIRMIPLASTPHDSEALTSHYLDPVILRSQIQRDVAAGLAPCAILAMVGASNGYQLDDLRQLRIIADDYGMWVHTEGSAILLGCSSTGVAGFGETLFACSDSICDAPLTWLDSSIADSPGILLVKEEAPVLPMPAAANASPNGHIANPAAANPPSLRIPPSQLRFTSASGNLVSLYYVWSILMSQPLGYVGKFVDMGLQLCQRFRRLIASVGLESIGPPAQLHPDVVFFRLVPSAFQLSDFNLDIHSLNKWLGARVRRVCGPLHIDEYIFQGMAGFLFHPLFPRNPSTMLVQFGAVDEFVQLLLEEATLIQSAQRHRAEFKAFVDAQPHLQYVPAASALGFVGVGAFRFVPQVLGGDTSAEIAGYEADLNLVNQALAKKLQQLDHFLYSSVNARVAVPVHPPSAAPYTTTSSTAAAVDASGSGASSAALSESKLHDVSCVVVRTNSDVNHEDFLRRLSAQISGVVAKLDLPDKVLNRMAQVVQQGIKEAEQKLQDSHLSAFYPSNILRKVPVVGNIVGWLSPGAAVNDQSQVRTMGL